MIKQILITILAISTITSSCATTKDTRCAACVIGVCVMCRASFFDMLSLKCKEPTSTLAGCRSYKNATECSACSSGYYMKSGVCTEIVLANCNSANDQGECNSCKNGKKYDSATKKCTDTNCVTENCNACMVTGTVEVCIECNLSTKLSYTGSGLSMKTSCASDSSNCASDNPLTKTCMVCDEGYYMMGSKCLSGSSSVMKMSIFMISLTFLLM